MWVQEKTQEEESIETGEKIMLLWEFQREANSRDEWKAIIKEIKQDNFSELKGAVCTWTRLNKAWVGVMKRHHTQVAFHVLDKGQVLKAAN